MAWGVVMFVRGAVSVICSFPFIYFDIKIYSLAGGIFLLKEGQYFFFVFPEWFIYGGIGMGVGVLAALNVIALSTVSVRQPGH